MKAQTRLLASLVALIAVVAGGALGYRLIEDRVGIGDAVYMTLITVSTVGFREVFELSAGGRAWTSLLIMLGILIVAVAFASVQAMIVGGELRTVLGRRKLEDRISRLSGHYIVCGYGRMGRLIAQGLKERGKTVVVTERDPQRTVVAGEDGVDYVLGDAADEAVLTNAGIERALGVISVLDTDAQNVYVTLTATGVRPGILMIARAEQPASEAKLTRAGATRVICPHTIGATRIVNLLVRPMVARDVDVFASGTDWEVEEYPLAEDSSFVGRSLREINLRQHCEAWVFAIRGASDDMDFNPDPAAQLQVGDVLIIIGPVGVAEAVARLGAGEA